MVLIEYARVRTQRRNHQYYQSQTIVSLIMIVLMAYGTLFIANTAVPARTGTIVTLYLTMSNIQRSEQATIPKVKEAVWLLEYMQARSIVVEKPYTAV